MSSLHQEGIVIDGLIISKWDRSVFGLMTSTSLRVSGDIHLRDADVDLEQRTLRVIALWLGHESPTTRLSRLGYEGTCPGATHSDDRDRLHRRA
jgi:hypothetical protein